MHYTDGLEQAAEYAKSALDRMAEQGIPSNPMNFTVWFAYASRRDPDLVGALDKMLSNKMEFSDERNQEIYEKYFAFDVESRQIRDTSNRLQSAVNEILDHIAQAGRDQSAYGEKLAGFSGKLDVGGGAEEVAELVRGIVSETRQIAEKNEMLEGRLGESSQQIDELRQNLEEVRREAMTDSLTGLANRKYFDSNLRELAEQAMEGGSNLCLLLTDIDHFKKFNDTYGHLVGDEVLKVVGRMLKEGVKGRDVPARYGGEEFAIILPQTSLKDAVTVAEHIRESLATKKLKNKRTGESFGTVTLSIGVARYRFGEPLDDLVQRADEALYRAKSEGRNRVVAEVSPDMVVDLAG